MKETYRTNNVGNKKKAEKGCSYVAVASVSGIRTGGV